jgi:hypothetical protein
MLHIRDVDTEVKQAKFLPLMFEASCSDERSNARASAGAQPGTPHVKVELTKGQCPLRLLALLLPAFTENLIRID